MNFLQSVVSKEEKQDILNNLQQINIKLGILADGNKDDLAASFLGLKNIIESYLTPEEKDITEIHNKISIDENKYVIKLEDAIKSLNQQKEELRKTINLLGKLYVELKGWKCKEILLHLR